MRLRSSLRPVVLAALLALSAGPAAAVEPDEVLADPALEERARDLSRELRCLVCQNQSIDDSHAALARDLRLLVRDRLTKGDSNAQVLDYVTERYGDFVLLKPPFKTTTAVLWGGPFAILLIGGIGVFLFLRNRQRAAEVAAGDGPAAGDLPPDDLTDDERRRVERLLAGDR